MDRPLHRPFGGPPPPLRGGGELHYSMILATTPAPTVLRLQVINEGLVLFERGAAERAFFEAVTLAAYARLNEERRGILDDVKKRGRVLG